MVINKLTGEQVAELIEATEVELTTDVGVAYLHDGVHPEHGRILVISTMNGNGAVCMIDKQ